jgi:hypothetical protein
VDLQLLQSSLRPLLLQQTPDRSKREPRDTSTVKTAFSRAVVSKDISRCAPVQP